MAPRRKSGPRVSLRRRRPSTPEPVEEDVAMDEAPEETPVEDEAPAEEEVATSPVPEPDDEDDEETYNEEADAPLAPSPRRSASVTQPPKRRGPGRPRIRPLSDDEMNGSDSTPRRGRGRGRGSRGGFRGTRGRGRGRGGAGGRADRPILDADGNELELRDDEVVLEEDPEGPTKVDKDGNLLGGREYRVRTFTIFGRENRLYMLSTEPARCTGFRDSYLFFTKHPTLYKIILSEEEKLDLIDRDLMPHSYKGRAIGVVTARSVFREFGAKIVVGGKRVLDDFQVQKAKEEGAIEGEVADPNDRVPKDGSEYNRNQYVAWHGASAVYHSQPPNVVAANQPLKRRKVAITSSNWMYEHALEASRFNAELSASRKTTTNGVYDVHTNLYCYPSHMQPTVARWEKVETENQEPPLKKVKVNGVGLTNGLTNGYHHDDEAPAQKQDEPKQFPPVSNLLARNFLITDTYFQMPPHATFPLPGPSPFEQSEREEYHIPERGLPDLTEEELAGLPDDCREALGYVKKQQSEWMSAWGSEVESGARGRLKIGTGI